MASVYAADVCNLVPFSKGSRTCLGMESVRSMFLDSTLGLES